MDVVGHPDIGIESRPLLILASRYTLEVGFLVVIIKEDVLPLVASDREVMEGSC